MSNENEQGGTSDLENALLTGSDPKAYLAYLKERADFLGISYSPNIGAETLKARIEAKMENLPDPEENQQEEPNALEATAAFSASRDTTTEAQLQGAKEGFVPKQLSLREQLIADNMKLVRVRITCMDPKKKDLPGEMITVANRFLGNVSKFVPFGEVTEDGYHIPYIIYKMLNKRRFVNIRTRKGKGGSPIVESGWAKEFAIEVLPPLTESELKRLATAQTAAGSIDNQSE